jgi:hypothetical protein
MILLPPVDNQPSRPETLSFTYHPVAAGDRQRIRLEAPPWQSQVEPSLMLVFTNGTPGSATVSVDGQVLLDQRLETPVAAVRLGALSAGEHELSIRANGPVAAFLNFLRSETDAARLQRFCTMASSNTLSFPYVKRDAGTEVLVLRIFSPVTARPEPFDVRLRLRTAATRGIGPFPELTLMEREATISPLPAGNTWLVAAAPAQLDDGAPVFFPVGPDLPPGRYDLEVRVAAESPRWLSLSRTTPGLAETLKLTSQHRTH